MKVEENNFCTNLQSRHTVTYHYVMYDSIYYITVPLSKGESLKFMKG